MAVVGVGRERHASLGFIADSNVPLFFNGREFGVARREFLGH